MTISDMISTAMVHLEEGQMVSSAKLAFKDGVELYIAGKEKQAAKRLLHSLSYSVGVFHGDYEKVKQATFQLFY